MMDSLLLYKIFKNRTGAEISASGNPAIMSDTLKNNPMNEMKVFGWSKQETTTGAQLWEFGDIKSLVVAVKNFSTSLKKGKYTITADVESTDTDSEVCLVIIGGRNISLPRGKGVSATFDVTKDGVAIQMYASNNYANSQEDTVSFKNVMLNAGDTALPYEPYTGGQPSPSPDYPQQIVSAGSDGKIEVNVRGKNLVDVYGYSANGIPSPKAERILFNTYGTTLSTTEKTDKLIVHQEIIDGATANSYTSGYFCIGINRKLETGKDYIITFNINVIQNPFSVSTIFVLFNGIEANRAEVIGDKVTVKVSCKEDGERQYVEVRNCGMSLEISNFMITEKDENTIYEPYYEPQTISISTPTGLPAIPVDSDGNYTDANGQQWIADYIDLKRGKYVQMVQAAKVPNDVNWNMQTQSGGYKLGYCSKYIDGISTQQVAMSNAWKSNMGESKNTWSNKFSFGKSNVFWIVPYENEGDLTSDDINAWLTEHPMDIMYPFATPIERDLTPEEIQAYKNLVTYAGTTIVENNAECYMEVSAGGGDNLRAKKLALLLGD